MLVAGVVDHQLGDDLQSSSMSLLEEGLEIRERAEGSVDRGVVGDVVSIIAERRGIERQDPEDVDPQVLQVVELAGQPLEVADAIAVRVEERFDMGLIDDPVFVPERIVSHRCLVYRNGRALAGIAMDRPSSRVGERRGAPMFSRRCSPRRDSLSPPQRGEGPRSGVRGLSAGAGFPSSAFGTFSPLRQGEGSRRHPAGRGYLRPKEREGFTFALVPKRMQRVPRATYRLQFNPGFTFNDAGNVVGYLADLGISDVYASPILKARHGSSHGYDVVDAGALNPELGTDEDFTTLHELLQRRDLGFLLDIVPNHMAASPENAWWMSVLENGPHSRFLHYFDIDWSPVTSRGETVNKVLLPILGKPYGEVLDAQELSLGFDQEGFFFTYFEKRLPLAPGSYQQILRECVGSLPREGVAIELRELIEGDASVPNSRFLKETLWRIYEQEPVFRTALDGAIHRINGQKGDLASLDELDSLLDAQWYRLAYWRIASEKINYRRFFDVTDLVGVRVENPEVFEARNRRTLELIAEGKVTGLRIDHIDGLYDPIGHMRKLQLRLGNRSGHPGETEPVAPRGTVDRDPEHPQSFYVLVEKILAHGEDLPAAFPVSGTTGYDFLDSVNALFVDPQGLSKLDRFYRTFSGVSESFVDICYQRKKQVIHELFSGEMRAMGKQLSAVAMGDRNARDFAPVELTAALTEVTACMSVYRTYIRDDRVSDEDRVIIRRAIAEARARAVGTIDERLFLFLERVLLVDPPSYVTGERDHWLAFVMRWQQFTGRVMAKGVEDTSFYNYNRLLSLNEVGGEPGRDETFDGLAEFHQRNIRQQRDWPHTLNATATHDTKRSEDARARINVLSEMPEIWARQVRRWSKANVTRWAARWPPTKRLTA